MYYCALIFVLLQVFSFTVQQSQESQVKNEITCGTSFLQIQTSQSLTLEQLSKAKKIRITEALNITECVKSCCRPTLLNECHIAIVQNTTCYNVRCESLEECRLSESSSNNTVQTVLVREFTRQCSELSKSCEVGVDNCFENEECQSISDRRRNGCCECKDGFMRSLNGTCLVRNKTTENETTDVVETTFLPWTSIVTTPATTSTTRYIRHLAIHISPTSIQLPELKSNITAIVVPDPELGEEYSYTWVVVNYPQDQQPGTIEGNNEKTLKLSQLSPGNYTFHITVKSPNSLGEAIENLTVLAPLRVNEPPVAVIVPSSQTVHLPNNVAILDGRTSTDDTKIVSYKWNLEKGPISYQFEPKSQITLELNDLVPGNYTFGLTVTDSDGDSNSTLANVEVIKETDYPPEANAGEPVVIYLPQNQITLNGNKSTDDHGITSWEWILMNDGSKLGTSEAVKAVDMQNTRTPYPQISNLAEGMYRFQLKVYDVAGQSSTAQVDVFVRRPATSEPRVDAGKNTAITLPLNWALLDGSKSRAVDDIGIHKWLWTQLEGPNTATLVGNDQPQVNVTGLTKGLYVFQLTAWDDSGVSGIDNVSVSVLQKENEKPKANAGGDQSVSLPLKWIILNGSASTDDLGIQSWLWTREPESLAAGAIIANSDRTNSLMLTNLVPGKYVFRLTVTDAQGLSDHDVATLIIHSNPRELDVVTITLRSDPRSFTDSELTTIREQIALLLHQQGSVNININIDDVMVEPKSGYTRTVLQFFTTVKSENGWRTLPGTEVAALLKKKLRNDINLLAYPVLEVDTFICQNNCSGHGVCDQVTRRCNCQTFWMENPISVSNGADYNCDWSLVYVVIIVVILVILMVLTFGSLVYLCRKGVLPCKQCCPKKRRRLHRYSPLADPEIMRMTHKVSNSLLPSDLDSDTDSDVIFESKGNGHANGRLINGRSEEIHA
ncbi:dyslexia-associated protein KIAA0319-like protein [Daphnia pulex]|nr:dyslexia-associated protein KIAA0319-like protein [Daphnia pulex]